MKPKALAFHREFITSLYKLLLTASGGGVDDLEVSKKVAIDNIVKAQCFEDTPSETIQDNTIYIEYVTAVQCILAYNISIRNHPSLIKQIINLAPKFTPEGYDVALSFRDIEVQYVAYRAYSRQHACFAVDAQDVKKAIGSLFKLAMIPDISEILYRVRTGVTT